MRNSEQLVYKLYISETCDPNKPLLLTLCSLLLSSKVSNSVRSTQSHLGYIHVSKLVSQVTLPLSPNHTLCQSDLKAQQLSDKIDCAYLGLSAKYLQNKVNISKEFSPSRIQFFYNAQFSFEQISIFSTEHFSFESFQIFTVRIFHLKAFNFLQ